MSFDDLTIATERIDTVYVTKLQGALSGDTQEKCVQALKGPLKNGSVILDLEELSILTSRGILALQQLNEISYLQKTKVILINVPVPIRQAMSMAGVKDLFPLAPNEEVAFKLASKGIKQ